MQHLLALFKLFILHNFYCFVHAECTSTPRWIIGIFAHIWQQNHLLLPSVYTAFLLLFLFQLWLLWSNFPHCGTIILLSSISKIAKSKCVILLYIYISNTIMRVLSSNAQQWPYKNGLWAGPVSLTLIIKLSTCILAKACAYICSNTRINRTCVPTQHAKKPSSPSCLRC